MKKLSLYISIALAGLFMGSCSEDFKDWADPQTNPQEDAITIPGYQASAVDALDLAKVAEDSMNVYTISSATLPEGFELGNSRIELTPEGVENATATEVKTSNDGKATKADLQALIESVYGKAPVARTFDGHVYTTAVKDGQAALIDAGTVKVTATPVAPNISQNYYIIGVLRIGQLMQQRPRSSTIATLMFTTTQSSQSQFLQRRVTILGSVL